MRLGAGPSVVTGSNTGCCFVGSFGNGTYCCRTHLRTKLALIPRVIAIAATDCNGITVGLRRYRPDAYPYCLFINTSRSSPSSTIRSLWAVTVTS